MFGWLLTRLQTDFTHLQQCNSCNSTSSYNFSKLCSWLTALKWDNSKYFPRKNFLGFGSGFGKSQIWFALILRKVCLTIIARYFHPPSLQGWVPCVQVLGCVLCCTCEGLKGNELGWRCRRAELPWGRTVPGDWWPPASANHSPAPAQTDQSEWRKSRQISAHWESSAVLNKHTQTLSLLVQRLGSSG